MSRDHSPGRAVFPGTHGSRCRAGAPNGGVQLSEREVDSEKLARYSAPRGASSIAATAAARQHPWRGVLRLRRNGDAQTTDDRKTARYAAPRYGRVTEDAGTGPGGSRSEFPGTLGPVGRSAVELAR